MTAPRFIIVSGLPASGKSTVASAVGALAVGQLVGIDTEAALSAGPLSRCVAAVRAAAVISAYSAN